jgi:predicted DNA-binding transcriptional regulator AlpA
MTDERNDDLLSRDEIEAMTGGGITRRWLELAAWKGEGPPMLKISRRMVRYRRSDFEAWLKRRAVTPVEPGE